jgi:hypothetical protein
MAISNVSPVIWGDLFLMSNYCFTKKHFAVEKFDEEILA